MTSLNCHQAKQQVVGALGGRSSNRLCGWRPVEATSILPPLSAVSFTTFPIHRFRGHFSSRRRRCHSSMLPSFEDVASIIGSMVPSFRLLPPPRIHAKLLGRHHHKPGRAVRSSSTTVDNHNTILSGHPPLPPHSCRRLASSSSPGLLPPSSSSPLPRTTRAPRRQPPSLPLSLLPPADGLASHRPFPCQLAPGEERG